ncbi:Imm1 family immunity protein [Kribbella solani]|uniref:Imm1 family immunity protein n=1 Tax=Kribbella solani TaxID=236067 RepID=UPI0029BF29DC|nr:Imm1 family immunity protein [Kribbella solani]MDX3002677.1 Imm1 family immunity protein [Kribbella solani]
MTELKATYDYVTIRVASAGELEELLDKVASLPLPTWLELAAPAHDVLHIGLGRNYSALRFIERRDGGEAYHSTATLEAPDDGSFQLGTVPTTMDPDSAISIAEARTAAAEFQRTGQRPTGIGWTPVRPTTSEDAESFSWDEWDVADS